MKTTQRWLVLAGTILLFLISGPKGWTEAKEDKTIKIFNDETGKYEDVSVIAKDEQEWRSFLTKEQFHVMREHGTERPFTGALLKNKETGVYTCGSCGTPLFTADTKYDSGTGWPSFWKPIAEENIGYSEDNALFMRRTEVHCPRCGAHLGHVFDDGPAPTHRRYCINSVSLKFKAKKPDE